MIISIASGKGGTGKTSLIAAFASLTESKVLCDADVDAADLHLIMNPQFRVFTICYDSQAGHAVKEIWHTLSKKLNL
jgi:MinD superfamily P-loop ATPase